MLHIRRGGKRIGLGLKQMRESPWLGLERTAYVGQIVAGIVTRVRDFGAFRAIRPGVEGLVPASESGVGPTQRLRGVLQPGQKVSARILTIDTERERLALSFLHGSLLRIQPDESENAESFEGLARSLGTKQLGTKQLGTMQLGTMLGDELGRALRRDAG